jgi:glycosyltransferase involved in cell wall biosynthesis
MKIVHVLTRFLKAGSEENTLLTCEGQLADGHEVHIVYGQEFDPEVVARIDRRIRVHQVVALVHPLSPVRDVAAVWQLARLFDRLEPDVVHTHQSKAGIVGRAAARLSRSTRHVVHGVHIVSFDNQRWIGRTIYMLAERIACRWTDAFVSVSEGVKRSYLRANIGALEKHHVVYSGMNLEQFRGAEPPADWRAELGFSPDAERPFIILMLAAYEPRKRHVELVKAFRSWADADRRPHLVFAGSGTSRTDVQSTVDQLGLGTRVSVLGFRSNPEQLIAMADVCVLTSEREGLPRVVVQYLAGGKPAVVSHVSGIEEIIEQGVNGFVEPADDIAAVVTRLRAIANDDKLRERVTLGAVRSDVDRWSKEQMRARMAAAYEAVFRAENA